MKIHIFIYVAYLHIWSDSFSIHFQKLGIRYLKLWQFGAVTSWLVNDFKRDLNFFKKMIGLVIWGFGQLGNNAYSMGGRARLSLLTRASEAYLWSPERHID